MRSRGAVRPGTARRVGVRGAVAPARLPRSRPSGARLTARERPASLGDVSPMRLRGAARRGTARSAARGAVVPARLPLSRAGAEARGAARWVPPRRAAGGAAGREAPAARRGWVARLAGAARGGAARCGARWGARCACPGRDPRCLVWPASAVVPRGMDHAAAKTAMQSARERRFMAIPSLRTTRSVLVLARPIAAFGSTGRPPDPPGICAVSAARTPGSVIVVRLTSMLRANLRVLPDPRPAHLSGGRVGRPRRLVVGAAAAGKRVGGFSGAARRPPAPPRRRCRLVVGAAAAGASRRLPAPTPRCPCQVAECPLGSTVAGTSGSLPTSTDGESGLPGRTTPAGGAGSRHPGGPSRPLYHARSPAAGRGRPGRSPAFSCHGAVCAMVWLASGRPMIESRAAWTGRAECRTIPGGRRSDDERDSHEFLRAL